MTYNLYVNAMLYFGLAWEGADAIDQITLLDTITAFDATRPQDRFELPH